MNSAEPDQLLSAQEREDSRSLRRVRALCVALAELSDEARKSEACAAECRELLASVLRLLQEDPNAEAGMELVQLERLRLDSSAVDLSAAERLPRNVISKVRVYVEGRLRGEFSL